MEMKSPMPIWHLSNVRVCKVAGVRVHKVARLEFQPFRVVKHSRDDLPLTDNPAAHSPSRASPSPIYPAASSTIRPTFRAHARPTIARATTKAVFFVLLPLLHSGSSQQAAAVKVILAVSRKQQNFSKTPSELTSLIQPRLIEPDYLLDESSVSGSAHSVSVWEVY